MSIKKIAIAFTLTIALLSSATAAADLTKDQRISDARTIISLFEHRYAPAVWKSEYLGIDLDVLAAELMGEAYRTEMNDEDFYAAMARFAGGVNDTHIWFIVPSTYHGYLDFGCDYVEGRYLIRHVNRQALKTSDFPFEKGDELISMDGVPVQGIVENLRQYNSHGNELAEKRFVARSLTYRSQQGYVYVPEGEVDVEIYSQSRGETQTVTLEWQHGGNPLGEVLDASPYNKAHLSSSETFEDTKDALSDLEDLRWSGVSAALETEIADRIGDMRPFFPIWKNFKVLSEHPIFTGTFKLGNKNIGFIRIPTWHPPSPGSWINLMAKIIPTLEKETDALLIDQTNNGGGWICLADMMSGFFNSKPIPNLKFQIRSNRMRLQMYESNALWCKKAKGKEAKECKVVSDIADELRRALAEGDTLTKPIDICGGDGMIHPAKDNDGTLYVYTKPLLMLVNEWSISAADMFPAPLQDAGRAKIFGSQTCGAGGSVITTGNLGYSDFRVSQTQTIAVRSKDVITSDGVSTRYIENVGVMPDVPYSITTDDFMNDYGDYVKAVEKTLLDMVN